jgi:hypothetical protein
MKPIRCWEMVLCISFLFALLACEGGTYNVILAVDSKDYRPGMTWDEIRERGFKMTFNMRVYDSNQRPIALYRYNHDDGCMMRLNETEIHISTPIIIEKKYENFLLSVLAQGKEVSRVHVTISDLKAVKGGPRAYVVPLTYP